MKRVKMLELLASFCWGNLYMIAVGIWFARMGFGTFALYVAIPGWLGYFIPFLLAFIDWRRGPQDTEVIATDMSGNVKKSMIIWVVISMACLTVNLILTQSDTFLRVFWAWMSVAGLCTLPLLYFVLGETLKRDKPGQMP
jgi:hypothetical protein